MKSLKRSESTLAFLLIIPSLLILIVIAIYPLGSVFFYGFTNRTFASSAPVSYVGLENYRRLLSVIIAKSPPIMDAQTGRPAVDRSTGKIRYQDPIDFLPTEPNRYKRIATFDLFGAQYVLAGTDADFIRSLADTVAFTAISVLLETILGMIVALILVTHFPGRGLVRMTMLIPWAIPTAVSSRMWAWMFTSSRAGIVNVVGQMLGLTNGQFSFLTTEAAQLWVMVAIDVWKTTPFMALLLMAGLQMIPSELHEAARVDGCGAVRHFWKITLPLVKSTLMVALIFRTLDALRVFDLFQIVFAQNRYSMASFAYYQLIDNQRMGYSSSASIVIFVIIFVFNLLYVRLSGGLSEER